jgi:hypothetical protein
MTTSIFTTETTDMTPAQLKTRRNMFLGMLSIIEKGSPAAEKYRGILEEYLIYEDLKEMSIEEVSRFSEVLDDISLTEFFSQKDLVEAGFVTEEDYQDAEFEAMTDA